MACNFLFWLPGASERFRKWGGYKFVRTLYNIVVKVVYLKFWHKPHLWLGVQGVQDLNLGVHYLGVQCTPPCPHSSDATVDFRNPPKNFICIWAGGLDPSCSDVTFNPVCFRYRWLLSSGMMKIWKPHATVDRRHTAPNYMVRHKKVPPKDFWQYFPGD